MLGSRFLDPRITSWFPVDYGSVGDDSGQAFGLLDPPLDLGHAGISAGEVTGLVDLDDLLVEVGGVALGEIGDGVYTGFFEEVSELGADSVDAGEVDAVDPIPDQFLGNAGCLCDGFPAFGVRALGEKLGGSSDAGFLEFGPVCRADALDFADFQRGNATGGSSFEF